MHFLFVVIITLIINLLDFFKITGSLQRFCKDWFVIVTSETGKHPENKEKTNQNIKKKGRYEL